tara:strand:+ start:302 stop:691 length:390 start_codon:yes stop_codon:yes gene_type:complete
LKNKEIKIGSNKSFGLVFFVIFLLISLWPLLNDQNLRVWALIVSLIFLFLGFLNSKLLTPLNKIWFKFGVFLGEKLSPIIIGIIFFTVVTPTGLLMKIFKKDPLRLKKTKDKTYWIEKKDVKSSMKNQF